MEPSHLLYALHSALCTQQSMNVNKIQLDFFLSSLVSELDIVCYQFLRMAAIYLEVIYQSIQWIQYTMILDLRWNTEQMVFVKIHRILIGRAHSNTLNVALFKCSMCYLCSFYNPILCILHTIKKLC